MYYGDVAEGFGSKEGSSLGLFLATTVASFRWFPQKPLVVMAAALGAVVAVPKVGEAVKTTAKELGGEDSILSSTRDMKSKKSSTTRGMLGSRERE